MLVDGFRQNAPEAFPDVATALASPLVIGPVPFSQFPVGSSGLVGARGRKAKMRFHPEAQLPSVNVKAFAPWEGSR